MITIRRFDRQNITGPGPVALESAPQLTAGQSIAQGLDQVGDMFQVWQDEIDTADAKAADAKFTEQINDLLYNDQSGFMYTSGSNATSRRQGLVGEIEKARKAALDQLTPAARARAEASLQARSQSALGSVNRHTAAERKTYLNDAAEARVTASVNAAIFEPGRIVAQLGVADQEIDDIAAREGWAPEVTAAKKQEARDQVYLGALQRMMNVDPSGALDFFAENRDNMSGAAVAKVEQQLVPEIKRMRGRAAGAATFDQGVTAEYLSNIRAAESGGNDGARNPRSTATGRYQFVEGTWRQLMRDHPELGLTLEGRLDPVQQEKAIRVFTADNADRLRAAGHELTGGNLYAAHFLGAGGAVSVLGADDSAAVSSVVSQAVIDANPFLADMTVRDFKAWTVRKGGAGMAYSAERGSMADLVNIEDPVERQAAIEEYELRAAVEEGQIKAAQAAASQSVLEMIEGGASVNDLDTQTRQALGPDIMKAARQYEAQKRSGEALITDSATYVELSQLAASDPQAFINTDPMLYRFKLDDSDFEYFVNMRQRMQTEGRKAAPSVSSMLSVADASLRSVGITKTDEPEQYSAFQDRLTRWANANPQEADDPVKMQNQINAMLTPIVIDPRGLRNRRNVPLFEVDADGSTFTADDDLDITTYQEVVNNGGLQLNGETVTPEIEATVFQMMQGQLGREPSLSEMLTALALYYR